MKFATITILLAFFFSAQTQAQKTEEEFVTLLGKAKSLLYEGKTDESISLYKEIIRDSHIANNDVIESDALACLTSTYRVLGLEDSIVPLVKKALTLQNASDRSMIHIHTHIGAIQRNALNHDSALHHYKLVLELNKTQPKFDSTLMAAALMDVTGTFTSLNMGDSALIYCLESLKYVDSDKRKNNLTYAYTRISDVFKSLHNLERAEEYARKALVTSADLSFKAPKIEAKMTLAKILYLNGDYDAAIIELEDALKINDGKKNSLRPKIEISLLRCKLARDGDLSDSEISLLSKLKEETQEVHFKNVLKLLELQFSNSNMNTSAFETKIDELWLELDADNKLPYAKELLLLKYDFLKRNNSWEKALICKEELAVINNKYLKEQQQYSIYELEAIYKKTKQDNEIKLLDKQNEIQSIKINGKNKLLTGGAIGLGLISLLALFLFKSRKTIATQNQKISRSLDEKDTLLREIHHRVKNNLQVISSLLRLQSNTTDDQVAIDALKEGQSRVQSMSLIHQNLYQKENLTGIKMDDYLRKLCHNLLSTYDVSDNLIQLETNIADLNLDVDSVVPIGLIINELITNSLKYAFPDGREGKINITLNEENNKLKLVVEDNGVGIASMDEMGTTNSFGHRLINSFSRKLDAEVSITTENGTRVEMLISEFEKV